MLFLDTVQNFILLKSWYSFNNTISISLTNFLLPFGRRGWFWSEILIKLEIIIKLLYIIFKYNIYFYIYKNLYIIIILHLYIIQI